MSPVMLKLSRETGAKGRPTEASLGSIVRVQHQEGILAVWLFCISYITLIRLPESLGKEVKAE